MSKRIADGLWYLAITLYILAGVRFVPLHGDETTQIFMGRDFYYHVQGQTERIWYQDWDQLDGDEASEQQLRLINGTLPKYLFGAVAYLSGYRLEEINQQWAWGSGWQWNHTHGHVPPRDLLLRARLASASLLAVSAVGIFLCGYQLNGRGVAYLASAYYVLNPAVLVNGRRAMMEGSLLAFTVLAVLIALQLLQTRRWWHYALLGVVSGLAVASKHTAAITIVITFAVCGIVSLWSRTQRTRNVFNLVIAGLLALIVFLSLNPAWWSQPQAAMDSLITLRRDLLAGQVQFFGGYDTPHAQAMSAINHSLIVLPMVVDSDFDEFYSQQADAIAYYTRSGWGGVSLGGSLWGAAVMALLIGVGCWRLWCAPIARSSAWLVSAWLLAMIILTVVITPINWQRYYLPLYPVLALLIGLGGDSLLSAFSRRLYKLIQN